jgi:hypothetical protein
MDNQRIKQSTPEVLTLISYALHVVIQAGIRRRAFRRATHELALCFVTISWCNEHCLAMKWGKKYYPTAFTVSLFCQTMLRNRNWIRCPTSGSGFHQNVSELKHDVQYLMLRFSKNVGFLQHSGNKFWKASFFKRTVVTRKKMI